MESIQQCVNNNTVTQTMRKTKMCKQNSNRYGEHTAMCEQHTVTHTMLKKRVCDNTIAMVTYGKSNTMFVSIVGQAEHSRNANNQQLGVMHQATIIHPPPIRSKISSGQFAFQLYSACCSHRGLCPSQNP